MEHEQIVDLRQLLATLAPRILDRPAEPRDLAVEPRAQAAPPEHVDAAHRVERGLEHAVDLELVDAPAGRRSDGDLALQIAKQRAFGRILGSGRAAARGERNN